MDGDKAQYSCLMESLKRRRRLGPDELRLIAEHDSDEDHEGMTIEEEDFMDMELLDEGEEEDEEEQDEQRDQPTTSYRSKFSVHCSLEGGNLR
ncbi:uncharacterized protein LOC134308108 [Trichomycterus rosablanca]|uniref:uncharacterized protein LOC134305623 n=1 Tax=Trichomycterus rosablanca TaxID=2290929 RepID=UPI002F356346